MRSLGWVLIQYDWCLIGRHRHAQREDNVKIHCSRRRTCEDGAGDWNDVSTRQATPRTADNYQQLEEARKDSPLEPSEGAWPPDTLISDF